MRSLGSAIGATVTEKTTDLRSSSRRSGRVPKQARLRAVPGRRRTPLLLGAVLLLLAGCRENRLPDADATKRQLLAGRPVFARKCASCHTLNGDGKTLTASRFKYANLIDGEWRAGGRPRGVEARMQKGA